MSRASRVCPTIGCSEIVSGSARYCERCTAERGAAYNRKRKPIKYSYGKEWRKVRADHLRLEPLCVDCGRLATEVDHIIAIERGGSNDHSNLASRCKRCHSRKTASIDGGFGNPIKGLAKGG